MLLREPDPTPADLYFPLFGFPVRVHPFFWLTAVLIGGLHQEMPLVLLWVSAMFVGILVHELGHAFVQRYYGYQPHIVLYWLGGLAVPGSGYGVRRVGPRQDILISLAGPFAGFALIAVAFLAVVIAGYRSEINVAKIAGVPLYPFVRDLGRPYLTIWFNDLSWISVFWGLINLLPIFPLDGGQATRSALMLFGRGDAVRQSLQLSVVAAIAVAVGGAVYLKDAYMAIFFAYLAYSSYTALQFYSSRGRWY